MESKLLQTLRYNLHPTTLCTWANWYINMWDIYAQTSIAPLYPSGTDLSFKAPNELAYQRFRTFIQFLDIVVISPGSHLYCKRKLIAALLYVVTGGPNLIGAFPYEYNWLPQLFSQDLPLFCSPSRPYLLAHNNFNIDQLLFFNQLFDSFLS